MEKYKEKFAIHEEISIEKIDQLLSEFKQKAIDLCRDHEFYVDLVNSVVREQ